MMKEFLRQKLGMELFEKAVGLIETFDKFQESEVC